MDTIKLVTIIVGATGFWKLIEFLFRIRLEKRLKNAETFNLTAQAEGQIVNNWVQWSQMLEKRVKELESVAEENNQLKEQIENQRSRISELEGKVEDLKKENATLRTKLNQLTKDNGEK